MEMQLILADAIDYLPFGKIPRHLRDEELKQAQDWCVKYLRAPMGNHARELLDIHQILQEIPGGNSNLRLKLFVKEAPIESELKEKLLERLECLEQ